MNKYLLFVILLGNASYAMAQESYLKNRHSIRFYYNSRSLLTEWFGREYDPGIGLNYNYGIQKIFEIGVNVGYTYRYLYDPVGYDPDTLSDGRIFYSQRGFFDNGGFTVLNYGITVGIHPLTLLVSSSDFRLDLYVKLQLGQAVPIGGKLYRRYPGLEALEKQEFIWDYGAYAGASYYLIQDLGIFAEYGIGTISQLRFGLALKLKKK